jgi:hypothetical protein
MGSAGLIRSYTSDPACYLKRQAMYYDVTRRRVRETTFAVKKSLTYFCVCVRVRLSVSVCVLAYVSADAGVLVCACAPVALLIQHSTRLHIAICGLSGSTIFFDIFPKRDGFREKKVTAHKMCILIFSTAFI